ncbi:hypothetical protein OAS39_09150 [Pirellulales bacterium]|nr:hypothetical protein [Pirellulales bacterium]
MDLNRRNPFRSDSNNGKADRFGEGFDFLRLVANAEGDVVRGDLLAPMIEEFVQWYFQSDEAYGPSGQSLLVCRARRICPSNSWALPYSLWHLGDAE